MFKYQMGAGQHQWFSLVVLFGGQARSDNDGSTETRLDCSRVELHQQIMGQVNFLTWGSSDVLCLVFWSLCWTPTLGPGRLWIPETVTDRVGTVLLSMVMVGSEGAPPIVHYHLHFEWFFCICQPLPSR